MSASIVPQLVRKDFLLWRRLILIFYGLSVASIALAGLLHGNVPDRVLLNLGFTLLITPVGTLGVVLLMQTNVFEKAKSTQLFIMSLPVTAREFTVAKLLVNVPTFGALWMVTTAAIFSYAFGLGLLPPGSIPMVTMVCLGVFVAYTGILCVSLLSQSLGVTILAILFFESGNLRLSLGDRPGRTDRQPCLRAGCRLEWHRGRRRDRAGIRGGCRDRGDAGRASPKTGLHVIHGAEPTGLDAALPVRSLSEYTPP